MGYKPSILPYHHGYGNPHASPGVPFQVTHFSRRIWGSTGCRGCRCSQGWAAEPAPEGGGRAGPGCCRLSWEPTCGQIAWWTVTHRIRMYAIYIYMVTLTINVPQMLPYIAYIRILWEWEKDIYVMNSNDTVGGRNPAPPLQPYIFQCITCTPVPPSWMLNDLLSGGAGFLSLAQIHFDHCGFKQY